MMSPHWILSIIIFVMSQNIVFGTGNYISIARCRANCIQQLPEPIIADIECFTDSTCYMCWQMCEGLYTEYQTWAPLCEKAGENKCAEGCDVACDFFNNEEELRTQDHGTWHFHSKPKPEVEDDDSLVLMWKSPKSTDRKHESTSLTYILFWRDSVNPDWIYEKITAQLVIRITWPHYMYKQLEFKLLAVTTGGVVAHTTPKYPPTGYIPPTQLDLFDYSLDDPEQTNPDNGNQGDFDTSDGVLRLPTGDVIYEYYDNYEYGDESKDQVRSIPGPAPTSDQERTDTLIMRDEHDEKAADTEFPYKIAFYVTVVVFVTMTTVGVALLLLQRRRLQHLSKCTADNDDDMRQDTSRVGTSSTLTTSIHNTHSDDYSDCTSSISLDVLPHYASHSSLADRQVVIPCILSPDYRPVTPATNQSIEVSHKSYNADYLTPVTNAVCIDIDHDDDVIPSDYVIGRQFTNIIQDMSLEFPRIHNTGTTGSTKNRDLV